MQPEVIAALIGLVGIIVGAIPTYLFMREKGAAEVDKLKAETDRTKAEAEKIRAELQRSASKEQDDKSSTDSRPLVLSTNDVRFNLEHWLRSAKTVDLLGYNLKSLLQVSRAPIADAVARGAVVRVVLVDFVAPLSETFREHSNRPHLLLADWVTSLEHIRDVQQLLHEKPKVIGRFEVKVTNWIPSCSLIVVNANEDDGIAKIGVNSIVFRQPLANRLTFVLNRSDDPGVFDHFVQGFDLLWERDSKTWDGVVPQMPV